MIYFRLGLAVAVFGALSAFGSSNGGNLIGLSPASQALGGSGVANYTTGTDAIYKNPALLGSPGAAAVGKVNAEIYGTYFNQSASVDNGSGAVDSTAKGNVAPQVSATYRYDEKLALGLGVLGFGGAVADYTGKSSTATNPLPSLQQLETSFNLMRIAPAASYKVCDMLTVGVSPFLTYGQFQLNEDQSSGGLSQSARAKHGKFGVGLEGGFTLANLVDNLLLGVTVTSKSSQTYGSVLPLGAFGPNAATDPTVDDLKIDQPLEIAAGAAYKVSNELMVTLDYRWINWSNAAGYSDLGWKDQHVFGGGLQYKMDKLALRAGFNYGQSPIRSVGDEQGQLSNNVQGHQVYNISTTKLNLIAFPGIAESHITLGGGYQLTDDLTVDGSFVYSPKVTVTRGGTFQTVGNYSFTAAVTQWSLAAGLSYHF